MTCDPNYGATLRAAGQVGKNGEFETDCRLILGPEKSSNKKQTPPPCGGGEITRIAVPSNLAAKRGTTISRREPSAMAIGMLAKVQYIVSRILK